MKALLIVNIALFFLEPLAGWDGRAIARTFGLVPADVFAHGRIWQLVTYMFLHGSPMHLLFNMLWLWMFGSPIEHAWGTRSFLAYYFVCGVGGAITTWATGPSTVIPTVGASGAITGILVAYALMYPNQIVLFNFFFPIKIKYLVIILIAGDLLLSSRADGIARFAHLGGALFGFLYLKQDWRLGAFWRRMRGTRARWQMQQNARRRSQQQAHAATVDEILEKISSQGIDSLTERERQILREASRK